VARVVVKAEGEGKVAAGKEAAIAGDPDGHGLQKTGYR
jgi:hypothetical protein